MKVSKELVFSSLTLLSLIYLADGIDDDDVLSDEDSKIDTISKISYESEPINSELNKIKPEIELETYEKTVPEGYSLRSLAILHRHGDRTPIRSYQLDPYRDISNWPDGWGQLTATGKQRMYKLGEYFKKRYNDFWPTNIRQFYAQSSDTERCLESAYLVLAGSYQPTGRWIWNKNLNWVPIGVHAKPKSKDALLSSSVTCSKVDKEFKKIQSSPEYQHYEEKLSHFYPYLTSHTGENVNNIIMCQAIFDILKVQQENGLGLPVWVTDSLWAQLEEVYNIGFYFSYLSKIIQRVRTGPFFKDLKKRFAHPIPMSDSKIDTDFTFKKVFFYSSHDSMLAAVLSTLHNFNRLIPPYGASIIFELYESIDSSQQAISIFYLNDTYSETPIKLDLSFCNNSLICDYQDFVKYIDAYIPDDWSKECGRRRKYITTFS